MFIIKAKYEERVMSEIHMVCGYMGFGKTTLAKRLAKRLPAVRLTHDEFMRDLFGRNLPDAEFRKYMRPVADLMWKLCGEICRAGGNAVMDMGFWSKEDRRLAYAKASELADRVFFDVVECDMATAKRRVLARTENDAEALVVDEACFDKFVSRFEIPESGEGLPMVFHKGC